MINAFKKARESPLLTRQFDIDTENSARYSHFRKRIGAGVPPGLQIQCRGLIRSWVGSTPTRFRQITKNLISEHSRLKIV